jgi:hypothetical protein
MVQILPWCEIAVNSRRSVTDLHFKGESMSRISTALVAVVLFGMAGTALPTWADELPVLGDKKGLDEESDRSPDSTPAAEAFLLRAYPGTDIPTDASFAARTGWAA